jgi:hypothetical protein
MKTIQHIANPTLRPYAAASCFMQGTARLVRKDWAVSGNTTG